MPPLLQRLSEHGLLALPPNRLEDLAHECREYGEATVSVRYFVIADAAEIIQWAYERPVSQALQGELERVCNLLCELPEEPDEEAATRLARTYADSAAEAIRNEPA